MDASGRKPLDREAGQATPEYVGLILLVAVLIGGLVAAGAALPGGELARTVAGKLLCAAGASSHCDSASPLEASPIELAYGARIAALIGEHAPSIFFEDDAFVSLPVDFRECRLRACADSVRRGRLRRTQTGLAPVAFAHVIDCRDPASASGSGYECGGTRAGKLYLQYWLYYPDSSTRGLGGLGYHVDDWESYQVRVDPEGVTTARASSHRGYNGRNGGRIGNDTGWDRTAAWDTGLGALHVAAGSHAGMTQYRFGDSRGIRREDLELIPLEPLAATGDEHDFSVSPPWEKRVWRDPEWAGT